MRKTFMLSAALLAAATIALPAFAQSSPTTNPATPSSSQSMPESLNSLPAGAGAQSEPTFNGSAADNEGSSNTGMTAHARAAEMSKTE